MYGIETTHKKLKLIVSELYCQGLCNIQPLHYEEWNKLREGQDYTRIAYSWGKYGVIGELFFMKRDKNFAYI